MGENPIEKFRGDMAEAVLAFASDPSYAVAVARHAGNLLSRREAKAAREEASQTP